ncbi:proteoglycan 4-like [Anopheles gambiae]|uniref:proteoglycan 4-like n=1 Tax=Anopheles gambiae TaxID=7165 RepID=UPI002AC8C2BB|nr:proteoglycan 4-like [Anopheles gambiae]
MANDVKLCVAEQMGIPSGTSTPKVKKRCAVEATALLENASTPYRSGKKRLVLECDRTPLVTGSLNSSTRSLALSTPGRIVSTSRMISITRGIQTCPPQTSNRYCQVSVTRIPKPTTSTFAQTDDNDPAATRSPQKPIACSEIACQTDVPPRTETTAVTTQTISFEKERSPSPLVQREDAACQADVPMEVAATAVSNEAVEEQQPPLGQEYDSDNSEPIAESISAILNNIAEQYGIELQSSTEKKKKKKKAQKDAKQKEIDQIEKRLVNKTYKAIASKVDEKLSTILAKQVEEYGRKTVASRQRLVRWTKNFIRQQHRNRTTAAGATGGGGRKVILVRKIVRPPKRTPLEEVAVQCDAAELATTARTTVGTQWQRQKPMVTKKKPVSAKKNEPSAAGGARRQSMRQTKLSSYAKEQTDRKDIQGRQPPERKQQGERSTKSSKLATAEPVPAPSTTTKNKKASTPPPPPPPPPPPASTPRTRRKSRSGKKPAPTVPPEKIHIDETPPASSSSDSEPERKHFPYRSPPHYPSQCSKSTETSFLTPTRIRKLAPDQVDTDRQSLRSRYCDARDSNTHPLNPSVLLSPMERMYMGPTATAAQTNNRPEYNTFLVPLRPTESIPPTPPRMLYLNAPERRVLLRSRRSTGGMVREKPPEISIISSQQLYSQIGLAVEKALKAKNMPTLDTMYGDPHIEVFNQTEHAEQDSSDTRVVDGLAEARAARQHHQTVTDKFVCSSGKEDMALLGSQQQQQLRRPPFHTERSPSLSPIVYQDDNSGDEML